MPMRSAAAAATGALLGMSAVVLSVAPAAHAVADREAPRGGSAVADRESPSGGPAAPRKQRPPVTVAHRGASGHAPENTLAAVDKAHELGIRWVENDVQRTKDGELVVVHDTTLSRTTNAEQVYPDRGPWNVSDFTAAEIAKLDAGGWYNAAYKGARVPTLHEYMERVSHNRQNLLLELKAPEKYPGIEAQTLKELANDGWLDRRHTRGRLIIQSFNAEAVETVHRLKPAVKTGFLGTPETGELRDYAKFADQVNPRYTDVTPEYVRAVHRLRGPHGKRMESFTWTVNDASTARTVTDAGVDGIISNYPDVVRGETGG